MDIITVERNCVAKSIRKNVNIYTVDKRAMKINGLFKCSLTERQEKQSTSLLVSSSSGVLALLIVVSKVASCGFAYMFIF